jgi:hypothetical protein
MNCDSSYRDVKGGDRRVSVPMTAWTRLNSSVLSQRFQIWRPLAEVTSTTLWKRHNGPAVTRSSMGWGGAHG